MFSSIIQRHTEVRLAITMMSLIAIVVGTPGISTSWEFTGTAYFDHADESGIGRRQDPYHGSDLRQAWEDAKRRADTQAMRAMLEADRQAWRRLSQRLDEELARVIAQAERDAPLQAWITFLQLVSLSASLAQQIVSESTPAEQTATDLEPPADGLHVREQYQRVIIFCRDGECRMIEMQQLINEAIKPPTGVENPDIRQMGSQLHQAAAKLPALDCASSVGECVPLNTAVAQETVPSTRRLPSSQIDGSAETALSAEVFRLMDSIPWEQVTSTALDVAPVAGQLKAVGEVYSGRDLITGEPVDRWVAAIGLIPGTKLVIKGGKVLAVLEGASKVTGKTLKLTKTTKVSDILKLKKGSIQRASLPKGAPSWDEVRNMTWGEIEARARTNLPGYKKVRKLLTDKRFNK